MVEVTDKRIIGQDAQPEAAEEKKSFKVENVKQDPATVLINKVFAFVVDQPEFYYVLQLTRPERKKLAAAIAKTMTTFPHFNKLGVVPSVSEEA